MLGLGTKTVDNTERQLVHTFAHVIVFIVSTWSLSGTSWQIIFAPSQTAQLTEARQTKAVTSH